MIQEDWNEKEQAYLMPVVHVLSDGCTTKGDNEVFMLSALRLNVEPSNYPSGRLKEMGQKSAPLLRLGCGGKGDVEFFLKVWK